jgi:hypothetical protein
MAARLMALHFQYLEIDGVEFDTYWQNGGYKKISDIIFAECHIFIVSNLWRYYRKSIEIIDTYKSIDTFDTRKKYR